MLLPPHLPGCHCLVLALVLLTPIQNLQLVSIRDWWCAILFVAQLFQVLLVLCKLLAVARDPVNFDELLDSMLLLRSSSLAALDCGLILLLCSRQAPLLIQSIPQQPSQAGQIFHGQAMPQNLLCLHIPAMARCPGVILSADCKWTIGSKQLSAVAIGRRLACGAL